MCESDVAIESQPATADGRDAAHPGRRHPPSGHRLRKGSALHPHRTWHSDQNLLHDLETLLTTVSRGCPGCLANRCRSGRGRHTDTEGGELARAIDVHTKLYTTVEIERGIAALQQQHGRGLVS